MVRKIHFLTVLSLIFLGSAAAWAGPDEARPRGLAVATDATGATLRLDGSTFHETAHEILNARLIDVPGATVRLVTWDERDAHGVVAPWYAISLDGTTMATVRAADYTLAVKHGPFEPLAGVPAVEAELASGADVNVYLVQFVTQALPPFRAQLEALGGRIYRFMPNYAYVVGMSAETQAAVAALPYVRWVGPYEPAYRVEKFLRENRYQAEEMFPWQRYNIAVFESGMTQKHAVAERIRAIGGEINMPNAGKYILEATLTPDQLFEVARWDEVAYIDRWSPYTQDMDIVRLLGGADHIEFLAGYTGVGVRGEIIDLGFDLDHPDLASRPPIEHTPVNNDSHGTACAGICFGDGTGSAQARGLMPEGQAIVADWDVVSVGEPRYEHTGELVQDPYYAVFQTASVGSSQTSEYTTVSQDTDAALFDFDIIHCQSQSNLGSTASRPQAWAKNIVSGGAVNHYNSPDREDHCWCGGASIGPAEDGRIKPDLCFFYDLTWTTYSSSGGYGEFGGTSGATPSICGHIGLFHQMWSDGIFGNETYPPGGGPSGYDVFDNRPHMATAKAFMINTANQYPFTGTGADMTRVHQGWGMPDVAYMYDMREKISFIDETELLAPLETIEYSAYVEDGEPALRVTLVFADPEGDPAAAQQRINDLTLKVTSPSGTFYWGNNGLLAGNWSTPGGLPNTVDTVENVFVENPEAGIWSVEVIASEINEDSHVETLEMDADFALVVSGGFLATCTSQGRMSLNGDMFACEAEVGIRVVDCDLNTDDGTVETVWVTIASTNEPAGESVLLTETAAETADFRGTALLSAVDAEGTLWVSDGDTIIATYVDADDGQGGVDIEVTDQAIIDCVPPVISGVFIPVIEPRSATITFSTNEDATGTVRYGTACDDLDTSKTVPGFTTDHAITLLSLEDDTTYYFVVEAEDKAGNLATATPGGGGCYSFTTPEIPDFFTQQFSSAVDVDHLSLVFEPNGSVDYYRGCVEEIDALPVDPEGGTELNMSSADTFATVTLGAGASVKLYGQSYTTFHVGSNGFITFLAGDSDYSESLSEHFGEPRISALWDDLNPTASGAMVSWKQLIDRVVVTWENVPEYSATGSNTFQVEMRFDGTIVLSYFGLTLNDALIGISEGDGLSPDYYVTDLSDMGPCYMINIALVEPLPELLDPGVALEIPLLIQEGGEEVVAGSEVMYYRYGPGPFTIVPLTHLGGEDYLATLPPASCSANPQFYFQATGDGGTTVTNPVGAPFHNYQVLIGTLNVIMDDDFELDLGWTVENHPSVTDGAWERGVPADNGDDGDPTVDFDGSGQCFLTANRLGNSDLDGGPTYLISPPLDFSAADNPVVRYARWWSNDDQDGDPFVVQFSDDDGATWTTAETVTNTLGGWVERTRVIKTYVDLTDQVRIRFSASDNPNNSIDEGGVDAVYIFDVVCIDSGTGDLNCDGLLDFEDINPFVLALSNPTAWQQAFPGCNLLNGDMNGDGVVDFRDINPFVLALAGG